MFARYSQMLLSAAVLLNSPAILAHVPHRPAQPLSLDAWVDRVNARVSDAIDLPPGVEGTASAFIRRADDGSVAIVRIAPASPQLTKAARSTLSRIRRLPPLPAGIDRHHIVRVDILFGGDSERTYRGRREAMMTAAAEANRKLAKRMEDQKVALSNLP